VARNTERAWLLTDVVWPSGEVGRVVLGTSKQGEEVRETTTFFLVLKCRNAGKVPAWIDKVHGYVELVEGKLKDLPSPEAHEKREFATFGPVAPGESESSNVAFECQGHLRNDQLASIFMLVEYRDAFKKARANACVTLTCIHGISKKMQGTLAGACRMHL
jgi:hypothetical protein